VHLPRIRLWPHHQKPPARHLQGEEYEIERAELEAQRGRDQFAASLLEKAGHTHFPFLKDPFE
jgi:hypothetical protein